MQNDDKEPQEKKSPEVPLPTRVQHDGLPPTTAQQTQHTAWTTASHSSRLPSSATPTPNSSVTNPTHTVTQHTVVHYHPAQPHLESPYSPRHRRRHHPYAPPPGQTHVVHGTPAYGHSYSPPPQPSAPTYPQSAYHMPGLPSTPTAPIHVYHQPPPAAPYVAYFPMAPAQEQHQVHVPHVIHAQPGSSGASERPPGYIGPEHMSQQRQQVVLVPVQPGSYYPPNYTHAPNQPPIIPPASYYQASRVPGAVMSSRSRDHDAPHSAFAHAHAQAPAPQPTNPQAAVHESNRASANREYVVPSNVQHRQAAVVNVQAAPVPSPLAISTQPAIAQDVHAHPYATAGPPPMIPQVAYNGMQLPVYAGATPVPPVGPQQPVKYGEGAYREGAEGTTAAGLAGAYITHGIQPYVLQPVMPKKRRLQWTPELHSKFLTAVEEVGIDSAVPKMLLQAMKVPGLTRENVASHLQKHRESVRKKKAEEGSSVEKNAEAEAGEKRVKPHSIPACNSEKVDEYGGPHPASDRQEARAGTVYGSELEVEEDSSSGNAAPGSRSHVARHEHDNMHQPVERPAKSMHPGGNATGLPGSMAQGPGISIQGISLPPLRSPVAEPTNKQEEGVRRPFRSTRIWEDDGESANGVATVAGRRNVLPTSAGGHHTAPSQPESGLLNCPNGLNSVAGGQGRKDAYADRR